MTWRVMFLSGAGICRARGGALGAGAGTTTRPTRVAATRARGTLLPVASTSASAPSAVKATCRIEKYGTQLLIGNDEGEIMKKISAFYLLCGVFAASVGVAGTDVKLFTATTDTRNYTLTVASAHGTPVPSIGTNL